MGNKTKAQLEAEIAALHQERDAWSQATPEMCTAEVERLRRERDGWQGLAGIFGNEARQYRGAWMREQFGTDGRGDVDRPGASARTLDLAALRKRIARLVHPDRCSDPDAGAVMGEINALFDKLERGR